MEGLTIQHERRSDGAIVLKLRGRASALDHENLERQADTVVEAKPTRVVVDLSELNFLGSFGISLLLKLHKTMRARGGEVRIANPSPSALDVIKQTRLDEKLPIFADVDDAVG